MSRGKIKVWLVADDMDRQAEVPHVTWPQQCNRQPEIPQLVL
jgi:hypothetical protein